MSDHETSYQSHPVCPHCGHEHHDAFEWHSDSSTHDCDDCGEEFAYERIVSIDYTTRKIKPPADAAVAILSERPAL